MGSDHKILKENWKREGVEVKFYMMTLALQSVRKKVFLSRFLNMKEWKYV